MKLIQFAIVFLIFAQILTACAKRREVKGRIFERSEMGDGALLIRYQYQMNGKTFVDSVTVANIVISDDSIILVDDPKITGRLVPDFNRQ